jgi:oligopeptide transport system substrate-binding protein
MQGRRAGDIPRTLGAWRGSLVRGIRVAFPLVALIPLALAACGPTSSADPRASDQTFVWPLQAEASPSDEVLDPAEVSSAYDLGSAQMIYSGLVTLAPDLTVKYDSVKKIDVTPDGKQYTFHLLPNLHFSDGQPIHAGDFAYGIDRALDPHICDGTDASGNPIKYGNSPYGQNCTYVGSTYLNHILGANDRINGNGGGDHSVVSPQGDNPGKGVSVVDDQTLVIRLDQPIAYFLEALTYSTSFPLEKSLVDKYPGGQWVYHLNEGGCSGPFKVESYTATSNGHKAISYVPNTYWQATHGQQITLTRVIRPFIAKQNDEYNEYQAGNYDYTDVPGTDYPYARGQEDFHEVPGLEIQYFAFNFMTPPFDNQQVRQAFDLALNKQLLVDRILDGGGIPTNHIVPQGMPGYNPDLTNPPPDGTQSLTGNQAAAVQLLAQARQQCQGPLVFKPNGKPADPAFCAYIDDKHYSPLKEIDIYSPTSNESRLAITKAAVDQWSTVLGLNVQVQQVQGSFGTYYGNVQAGQYGAWALGWLADYPDPQDWLSLQFASNADYNSSHIRMSDLDTLMSKADLEQDPSARMQEYHQAEQELINQVPWIPYEQQKVTWRQRTWVHGFSLNEVGSFSDLAWSQVYITQH